jgi:hypothetical protein
MHKGELDTEYTAKQRSLQRVDVRCLLEHRVSCTMLYAPLGWTLTLPCSSIPKLSPKLRWVITSVAMRVHHFRTSAPFPDCDAALLIWLTASEVFRLISASQVPFILELLNARANSFRRAA